MGGQEKKDAIAGNRDEIFSKSVRAGKRTYFFDVKTTRNNDHYLTITESKKIYDSEGKFHFEKHKIFLYREDFEKFKDGLEETIDFIKNTAPTIETSDPEADQPRKEFTDVSFDDLGNG